MWHYLCFQKHPQNTIKWGENSKKNNLDQFLTLSLDQFLTLKPPNLRPVFNFTAYIYIERDRDRDREKPSDHDREATGSEGHTQK